MINITKKTYRDIKQHSYDVSPEESCGLLVDSCNKISSFRCANIADDKLNNFVISPKDYVRASCIGNIIGFYHSHPSPSHSKDFTPLDRFNGVNHKLPILLYQMPEDKFHILDNKELQYKYVGRKFEYNKHDCLSLTEEYYKDEFNIPLPKFERNAEIINNNPNIIINNIEKCGFIRILEKEQLKNGDLIITNSIKGPTHLMIYIGNNQVLHHRFNCYSTVEIYSDFYKQNTHTRIRHQSLWN